jgi:serine protease inhibitor ecotin
MRTVRTLALAGSLLVSAAAMSGAVTKKVTKAPAKKANSGMITCPIMHKKVAKKDAIKVTAANGKSTYVCCQGCVDGAKKQLMAKK